MSSRPADAELYRTAVTLPHGELTFMSGNVVNVLMETMQDVYCHGCLLGDPRMSPQLWCTFIFFLCFCSTETVVAKPRPARHVFPSQDHIFGYLNTLHLLLFDLFFYLFFNLLSLDGVPIRWGKEEAPSSSSKDILRGPLPMILAAILIKSSLKILWSGWRAPKKGEVKNEYIQLCCN